MTPAASHRACLSARAPVKDLAEEAVGLEPVARLTGSDSVTREDGRPDVIRDRPAPLADPGARLEATLKRTFDLVVAILVLLLALPVMAVIALAITIESPGPVFFRAERVGRGGRLIRMLKFRKMHHHAGGLRLTVDEDPRLTKVGAVLRRSRLDELPQLIHVIRGEMSLIGPRPEDPGFVLRRRRDYDDILRVRPGITGLSQIAFADEGRVLAGDDPLGTYLDRVFPAKCALDRLYVGSANLSTDLRILGWTAIAVILRRQVAVDRSTGGMSLRAPRAADAPVISFDRPVALLADGTDDVGTHVFAQGDMNTYG